MNDNYGYVNNGDDEYEVPEIVPIVMPETIDKIAWENFFHSVPQDQLEVFVFLYLGLKPKEIAKALHFPNVVRFYNINAKLKNSYREQKELFIKV